MKEILNSKFATHILMSRANLNELLRMLDDGAKDPTLVRTKDGHSVMVTAEENATYYADQPNHPFHIPRD